MARVCVVDERAGRRGRRGRRGGSGRGGRRGGRGRGGRAGRGAVGAAVALARYPQTAQVPVDGVGRVRRAPRPATLVADDAPVLQFW